MNVIKYLNSKFQINPIINESNSKICETIFANLRTRSTATSQKGHYKQANLNHFFHHPVIPDKAGIQNAIVCRLVISLIQSSPAHHRAQAMLFQTLPWPAGQSVWIPLPTIFAKEPTRTRYAPGRFPSTSPDQYIFGPLSG